jgi:hypothetical protein
VSPSRDLLHQGQTRTAMYNLWEILRQQGVTENPCKQLVKKLVTHCIGILLFQLCNLWHWSRIFNYRSSPAKPNYRRTSPWNFGSATPAMGSSPQEGRINQSLYTCSKVWQMELNDQPNFGAAIFLYFCFGNNSKTINPLYYYRLVVSVNNSIYQWIKKSYFTWY